MDSEGLFECSICQNPSDDLRLLSCTHSYCLACLDNWSSQKVNLRGRRIICPDCRQVTVLPEGGVSKLSQGISMRAAKQLLEAQQPPAADPLNKTCQFCSHAKPVHAWCVQCRRNLCQSCADAHRQRTAFQTHRLESIVMCEAHPGENAEYFCYPCCRPMCVLCIHQEDHQHDVVPLQKAYEEFKQKMEAASPELTPLVDDLKAIQDALLSLDYPSFIAQQHMMAKDKIKSIASEAIEDIKKWEQGMTDSLFFSVEAKQKAYDAKMESLNTAYAIGSTLVDHATSADSSVVLKAGQTLQQRVEDIKELHAIVVDFMPETVSFVATGKTLELDFGDLAEEKLKLQKSTRARLSPASTTAPTSPAVATASIPIPAPADSNNQYENWGPKVSSKPKPKGPETKPKPAQLTGMVSRELPYVVQEFDYSSGVGCELRPEAMAIAVAPDQSVIISDLQNGMLLRCAPDSSVPTILVQPGIMLPRGLAVGADGKIYTCEAKTKTIWIFDQNGGTVARWVKADLRFPKGIGVLQNGHVVVADRDLCKVFIYNASGNLLRSFGQRGYGESHFRCPGFITVDARDRILVMDYENKAIKIFAANSAFVTNIPLNWPKLEDVFKYQSVCTDADCNIYVAQKSQAKVLKLSQDGVYCGPCLSAKDPPLLEAPSALAMDRGGNIAISESTQGRRIVKVIKLL